MTLGQSGSFDDVKRGQGGNNGGIHVPCHPGPHSPMQTLTDGHASSALRHVVKRHAENVPWLQQSTPRRSGAMRLLDAIGPSRQVLREQQRVWYRLRGDHVGCSQL